jgi:hypothetical protein
MIMTYNIFKHSRLLFTYSMQGSYKYFYELFPLIIIIYSTIVWLHVLRVRAFFSGLCEVLWYSDMQTLNCSINISASGVFISNEYSSKSHFYLHSLTANKQVLTVIVLKRARSNEIASFCTDARSSGYWWNVQIRYIASMFSVKHRFIFFLSFLLSFIIIEWLVLKTFQEMMSGNYQIEQRFIKQVLFTALQLGKHGYLHKRPWYELIIKSLT